MHRQCEIVYIVNQSETNICMIFELNMLKVKLFLTIRS